MTMRITGSTSGSTAGYGSPASLSATGDSGFLRTAYYPGQFLTDRDLSADQAYAAEKRRVENRSLHGHGVVTGLQVELAGAPGWVNIRPGLALDPYGNEIRLLQALQADLRAKLDEALRRRAYAAASTTASVIVALQYDERAVDPQPAFVPQTTVDAPNKAARTREGYKLVLLLESDLDVAARKVLYWQADLLSVTPASASPLTTAEVDCPYVFLAMVSKNGEAYSVDSSVQRPVLSPEVFFKLVREYAPDLFTGASSAPAVRDAIAAQVGQVYSDAVDQQLAAKGVTVTGVRRVDYTPVNPDDAVPVVIYTDAQNRVIGAGPAGAGGGEPDLFNSAVYRATGAAVAAIFPHVLQEPLVTAVAACAIRRMPLTVMPVGGLTSAAVQAYLTQQQITTVGGLIDRWASIAPLVGSSLWTPFSDLNDHVRGVAGKVKELLNETCAIYVGQVSASALATKLGVTAEIATQILADAGKLLK